MLQDRIAAEEKLTGSRNNGDLPTPTLRCMVISTGNDRIILDVGHGSLNRSPTQPALPSRVILPRLATPSLLWVKGTIPT